ncbi:hypothetical protein H0H93_007528 [Arthromyces matolae]|nr:hypothetical protein H0H93_007528 [Arthromyces matolae]
MLFHLTYSLLNSLTAYIYPSYASYKSLSQRPASEQDLERWLMYWSVLGCLTGLEYIAEWFLAWIPFYYLFKTLFLLYLVLPQTQGSTYIYTVHLRPFFGKHEEQIDETLAEMKAQAYKFIQERFRALWDALANSLHAQAGGNGQPQQQQPPQAPQPAGPTQLVGTLWRTYGPGIMASGATWLQSVSGTVSPPTTNANITSDRLRQPELTPYLPSPPSTVPIPVPTTTLPSTTYTSTTARDLPRPRSSTPSTASSSSLGLRERTNSNSGTGRFEEIDVPSDVEGYDLGEGHDMRPRAQARTSWFGWATGAGAGASSAGYDRVKNE